MSPSQICKIASKQTIFSQQFFTKYAEAILFKYPKPFNFKELASLKILETTQNSKGR